MLSTGKDIVSGVYSNYFVSSGKLKILPVAWMQIGDREFEKIKAKVPGIKSREEIRRHMTSEEYESNRLIEVLFASAGCMLISKNVFEDIRYGLIDMEKEYGKQLKTTDDIYFFNEARKKGFKIFCHTKLKCDHLVSGKYLQDGNGNLVRKDIA